jgi:PAS domain-containing protein
MDVQDNRIGKILDYMLEGCQIISFDWQYLYLNEAAHAHSHLPKEELLGRKMMDVFPGIENTAMFQQLHKCMEQRQPVRFTNGFSYPDLTSGWFDISVIPVEEGILVMTLDLSLARERSIAREEKAFSTSSGTPNC